MIRARGDARPRPLAAGRRLFGRYRIERRLGRGGSAEVWLAHDERLDRTVAIKAPLPDALPDAASRDRFITEARAAAGLSHPAIVPVYDVVADPRTPALVLRYVDGESLAERLARQGRFAPADVARIGADLAGALAHAHAAGIVHRDVKPGNVLVDAAGRAQLLDFGIASSLVEPPSGGRAATRPTHVLGTLRYMSPEHLRGAPVDARSDLYALGLTLYELLSGTPAFEASSPEGLAAAQSAGPASLPPSVPSALRALIADLLAPDPGDRPADASAVEARLRRITTELDAAGPAVGISDVAPTIAPGLPAASAGLALLTPSGAEPAPDAPGSDGATSLLPVTLTVALPVAAAPSAPARAAPAGATPGASAAKPVLPPPPARPAGHRRSGLLAGVAGALVVGGIALAALVGGAWRGSGLAGDAASAPPAASGGPIATATPPPAPAERPKPPKRHHGDGNGNGNG